MAQEGTWLSSRLRGTLRGLSCGLLAAIALAPGSADGQGCVHLVDAGDSAVPGRFLVVIQENRPEIADSLTLACLAGTTTTGVEAFDEIGRIHGLLSISPKPPYSALAGRGFELLFADTAPLQDLMQLYCGLPYVEFVEPYVAYPTAIGTLGWGFIKRRFIASEGE